MKKNKSFKEGFNFNFVKKFSNKFSDRIKQFKLAYKETFAFRRNKILLPSLFSLFVFLNAFFREYLLLGKTLFANVKVFFEGIYFALSSMALFEGIILILLSYLSAVLLIMLFYCVKKNKEISNASKGAAGSGLLLSVLAPACPSCGLGVLSLVGFSSIGSFLPFAGKEIGVLGVIVVILSISYVGSKIVEPSCRLK